MIRRFLVPALLPLLLLGLAAVAQNLNLPGQGNLNQPGAGSAASAATPRNALIGGDFGTNPWQRGTSFTPIANVLTYTADRWAAIGGAAGSAITVARVTASVPTGFSAAMQFGRAAANANVTAVCVLQALETVNSLPFAGNAASLSFYAKAGANFSAASAALAVTIQSGTGADESAANMAAGTWTGPANALATTTTLTTTWQRYVVLVPTVGATVTQLGVKLCYTPVGTAGANDNILLDGVQLEIASTVAPAATAFEHRPPGAELRLAQRYAVVIGEPASAVNVGVGQASSTTVCNVVVALPEAMRAAPALTITAGTFATTVAAGTTQALTTLAAGAGQMPSGIALTATANAANLVAGNACLLQGGAGGTGKIVASSEL